jgi:hypothetical protein
VQLIGALGAGVDDHDDDRRVSPRARDERSRAGNVEQARVERVGRETEERHPDAVRAQVDARCLAVANACMSPPSP